MASGGRAWEAASGEDEWAMARMNNHISKRTAEKERAVTQIRRALDAIGNEDRQPDDWEKVSLAGAIDNVFRGLASGPWMRWKPASPALFTLSLEADWLAYGGYLFVSI
jgi:hypothetical protein